MDESSEKTELVNSHSVDLETLYERIGQLSREPFREVLSRFLSAEPDMDDIKAYAKKSPDRWAQAVTMLAKLSDYNEKTISVENNLYLQINGYSDAQLDIELNKQIDRLKPTLAPIEGAPDDV